MQVWVEPKPDIALIQLILLMMIECSKHVEIWSKHIRKKKLCDKFVIYENYTEMHGQQNMKFKNVFYI